MTETQQDQKSQTLHEPVWSSIWDKVKNKEVQDFAWKGLRNRSTSLNRKTVGKEESIHPCEEYQSFNSRV